jgi:hypothetical protein
MPKTGPITGLAGKWDGGCQTGGWGRVSDDGWDNITQQERGPQGPGEIAKATVPCSDAGMPLAAAVSKAGANRFVMLRREGSMLNSQVPGA